MNTITAKDINRHGLIALEEALQNGPVYIIKNNYPICVVLGEKNYQSLTEIPAKSTSLLDWMLNKPATGTQIPDPIKQRHQEKRNAWD
jgi:hypothetical protein